MENVQALSLECTVMMFPKTGVTSFVSSLPLQMLLQGVADSVPDTDVQVHYERLDLNPPTHVQHAPVKLRDGDNVKCCVSKSFLHYILFTTC